MATFDLDLLSGEPILLSKTYALASSASGWTDDGTTVRLTTAGDEVAIGTSTPFTDTKVSILSDGATQINLVLKAGAVSPSAHLFEWQDSSGQVYGYVHANFGLYAINLNTLDSSFQAETNKLYWNDVSNGYTLFNMDSGGLALSAATQFARGLIVQTTDNNATFKLSEWQNSAGTALVSIAANGTLNLSTITAGSILFAGTGGDVSQDNTNFFWDDTNNILRLGSTTQRAIIQFSNVSNAAPLEIREAHLGAPTTPTHTFWTTDNGGTTVATLFRDGKLWINSDLRVGNGGDVYESAGSFALLSYASLSLGSGMEILWGNDVTYGATKDIGLLRSGVGVLKVTNGSTGYGAIDVPLLEGTYTKALTESSATGFVEIAVSSNGSMGGMIEYTIEADDGTNFQLASGEVGFAAINEAGTLTSTVSGWTEVQALSAASTLSNTFTLTNGTNKITVNANAVSSLTQSTINIRYRVHLNKGTGTITPL